jgi:hypothetical protein
MRIYLIAGVFLLLGLSSCLTILQSLNTPGNIVTDNRVEGVWVNLDWGNIVVQKLLNSKFKNIFSEMKRGDYTPTDSAFYTAHYVVVYREKGLDYTWSAGMVKINDQYYLNLQPEECLGNNGTEAYRLQGRDFLTTSDIAKMEWKNNNSLVLHFINGDYIKEIVLNGKVRIRHEYDPLFDTFVITASPGELEQFLEKYGNNESLFKGGHTIILTRKN